MLVIVGMILLLTWIIDHAIHLTPSSLVDLLLLFATISFVLDFLRERAGSADGVADEGDEGGVGLFSRAK